VQHKIWISDLQGFAALKNKSEDYCKKWNDRLKMNFSDTDPLADRLIAEVGYKPTMKLVCFSRLVLSARNLSFWRI
jgi:hypothetical protein